MWLKRLVDTGGGPSRVGSFWQRGIGVLRQAVQGRAAQTRVPIGQPTFQNVPSKAVVPVLRTGFQDLARNIWRNRFGRNLTGNLMRQRYEFRLMSGFRLNKDFRGLAQKVTRYGFVAVGVAGSQWNSSKADGLDCENIKVAFVTKGDDARCAPWNLSENLEYDVSVLAAGIQMLSFKYEQTENASIASEESDILSSSEDEEENCFDSASIASEESDIIILSSSEDEEENCFDSEDDSDFEILQEDADIVTLPDTEEEDSTVQDLLQIIYRLGSKQQVELFMNLQHLLQPVCLDAEDAEFPPEKGELNLQNELSDALILIEHQQQDLCFLRQVVLQENEALSFLQSFPLHYARYEKLSEDLEPDIAGNENLVMLDDLFENISAEIVPITESSFQVVRPFRFRAAECEKLSWLTEMQWDPGE